MTACNTLCLRTISEALVLLSVAGIDQRGDMKQGVRRGLRRDVQLPTALGSYLNDSSLW